MCTHLLQTSFNLLKLLASESRGRLCALVQKQELSVQDLEALPTPNPTRLPEAFK